MDARLLEHALKQEQSSLLDLLLAVCSEFGWAWAAVLDMDVQCFWATVEWLANLRKREKEAIEGKDKSPFNMGAMGGGGFLSSAT